MEKWKCLSKVFYDHLKEKFTSFFLSRGQVLKTFQSRAQIQETGSRIINVKKCYGK